MTAAHEVKDEPRPQIAIQMLAALKRSTVQMRIWVSTHGDMVGALQEQIDENEAIIAAAEAPQ